jgi:protein phosphatase
MILRAAAGTNVGRRRRINEDRYAVAPELGLFLVADGMGGHTAGQVASELAAQAALRAVATLQDAAVSLAEKLRFAVSSANRAIFEAARERPELAGMGTTLVAVLAHDGRVALAHVGDSRAYLIRGDLIQQISEDHSLVNEQIKAGMITPEEAKHSRYKNIITRSVGFEEEVQVDVMGLLSEPGDVFVLCSDGMANMVEDPEILHIVRHHPLSEVPRTLVDLANERGGDDNITVIAVQVQAESVPVVASATTGEHAAL